MRTPRGSTIERIPLGVDAHRRLETHVARLADNLGCGVVVDVGAHRGGFGLALRRAGYRGRIVSFEPEPASFAELARVAADDPGWSCHRLALGAETGRRRLHVGSHGTSSSFLEVTPLGRRAPGGGATPDAGVEVPVRRLDAVFGELVGPTEERTLLRLATGGFDLEVLRGAESCLERVDALCSRIGVLPCYRDAPDWADAILELRKLGFEPTGFYPVHRQEPSLIVGELDCVLARRELLSGGNPARVAAAAAGAPSISVLVVTANDGDGLRRCLERIREQARPLAAEIVLVVNAPEQSLDAPGREELRGLCDVLVFEPRPGKSHGLNAGVVRCRGEVIAFTDDDAIPQPGWLEAITTPLLGSDRPRARVGTGGVVRPVYTEKGPPRWYRRLLEGRHTHFLGPVHDLGDAPLDYPSPSDGPIGAPLGANCAYRREVFARYHYDPDLGPNRQTGLRGGEDFEFAYRLLLDGHVLTYVPDARVEHPVVPERMTWRHVSERYYVNGVETIRLLRMLDLPGPRVPALRRRLRRRRRFLPLRRVFDPIGYPRRMVRVLERQGMLDEIERGGSPRGRDDDPRLL